MKFLNKLTDSSMVNEATDKKFVSDAEKTAITHSNRGVLDKLSEIGSELAYDGVALGGGSGATNLTLAKLTLGPYTIEYNEALETLDFNYIG